MKKIFNSGEHRHPHVKKLLIELLISIMILMLSFTNIFATQSLNNDLQQQITVTGTVTDDAQGDPLPGVNIVVKGTTIGALSDVT